MGMPTPSPDAALTAPLELPVVAGKPLTTQSGNTLDDGAGMMEIGGIGVNLAAPGPSWIAMNGNGIISVDSNDISHGTFIVNANIPSVSIGSAAMNVPLILDDAASISSGTGAPVIKGALGDIFLRTDTPTVADQRLYVCTVTGAAGAATWVGIL